MIDRYPVHELIPLISWEHFFHTWHVKSGTDEALRLRHEAEQFLRDSHLDIRFLCQPFEAHAEADDIVLGDTRIPFLRQQVPTPEGYCLCMSDFVHPVHDVVYVFATTVHQPGTLNVEPGTWNLEPDDPYRSLLPQTLADRLAEAAAERLQQQLMQDRRFPHTHVIRPAVGYPMMPDMSINFLLDQLCDLSRIGIHLTENGMMQPHASVSGLMIANPHASYFAVGPISEEQLSDYARRRGYDEILMRKFLGVS